MPTVDGSGTCLPQAPTTTPMTGRMSERKPVSISGHRKPESRLGPRHRRRGARPAGWRHQAIHRRRRQRQAHAAARVRAQVQMPLDLFDEAGIAVRLQAIAEAAAGVQLGIGLNIGDFLALAADDPRMRGAPMELLKIFLDEFTFQGGVMAKAAAAAMAYANLVATGSFIKRGSRLPGSPSPRKPASA